MRCRLTVASVVANLTIQFSTHRDMQSRYFVVSKFPFIITSDSPEYERKAAMVLAPDIERKQVD